jgi:exodeoxyribonuclease VII large subunit
LRGQEVAAVSARLREKANASIALRVAAVERVAAMLRILSPDATLKRGYTITTDGEGALLRTPESAAAAGKIVTRFASGTIESTPAKPAVRRKKKA